MEELKQNEQIQTPKTKKTDEFSFETDHDHSACYFLSHSVAAFYFSLSYTVIMGLQISGRN